MWEIRQIKIIQIKSLATHINNQKIMFWYIYIRKFTKYLHGLYLIS